MSTVTIDKKRIDKQKGLVILPIKEYEKLRERAVPTYYLKGKAAKNLDLLVESGLKEYRAGKTTQINSLADLG